MVGNWIPGCGKLCLAEYDGYGGDKKGDPTFTWYSGRDGYCSGPGFYDKDNDRIVTKCGDMYNDNWQLACLDCLYREGVLW